MSSFCVSNTVSLSFLKEDFFQIFKECYCHFPEKLFPVLARFGVTSLPEEVFVANAEQMIEGLLNSTFKEQFWAGKILFANDILKFYNTTICVVENSSIKYEDFRKLLLLCFSVTRNEEGILCSGINVKGSFLEYDFGMSQGILETYFEAKNSLNQSFFLKTHKEIVYSFLTDTPIRQLINTTQTLFTMKNDFEDLSVVCPLGPIFQTPHEEKQKKSAFIR